MVFEFSEFTSSPQLPSLSQSVCSSLMLLIWPFDDTQTDRLKLEGKDVTRVLRAWWAVVKNQEQRSLGGWRYLKIFVAFGGLLLLQTETYQPIVQLIGGRSLQVNG